MEDKPAEDLIAVLVGIQRGTIANPEATDRLRAALLAYGSRTEDTLACVEHIEVDEIRASFHGARTFFGVTIRGKSLPLGDIIWALEGTPIPDAIRDEFPNLTETAWSACMRFTTLLLSALDRSYRADPFDFTDTPSHDAEAVVARVPAGLTSVEALLKTLHEETRLPEYFGFNWDALSDCLRDLHWVACREVVLLHADVPKLARQDLQTYLDVLAESVASWAPCDDHALKVVFPSAAWRHPEIEQFRQSWTVDPLAHPHDPRRELPVEAEEKGRAAR